MKIGSYLISSPFILAPMAGVTDPAFRRICRRLGAGLAVSEMVTSNALLWGSEKTRRRIAHDGEAAPISVQIAGADPQQMAEAARFNVDNGAHMIDINMGCPAKKVCNVLAGSALMKDEPLVARILEAVVKAVPVPVTLKTRLGWDIEHQNVLNIAKIAEMSGIQALAIHGRTRACAYKGDARYERIAEVKSQLSIPVIANGDIRTPEKALEVFKQTGADAVMIGRGAQGNPWIFSQMVHFLNTGTPLPPPTLAEKLSVIEEHLDGLYRIHGARSGTRIARKHIAWYTHGMREAHAFRQEMYALETPEAQLEAVRGFFEV